MKHLKKFSVLLICLILGLSVLTGCGGMTAAEEEKIALADLKEANLTTCIRT